MSAKRSIDRRGFLARGLAIASASLLGGCDSGLSDQPWVKRILDSAEALTRATDAVDDVMTSSGKRLAERLTHIARA